MNGDAGNPTVITAKLPSGAPVKIEVTGVASGDGMTSVGLLPDLDMSSALDTIGEVGSAVMDRMRAIRPTKATVELKLGFSVEAGKLIALWVGGKGEGSLTVTLEWAAPAGPAAPADAAGGADG